MTALDTLATIEPETLGRRLPEILEAAERGSVIAKDKAVFILCKLVIGGQKPALPALFAMLQTATINQLPSYAEAAAGAATSADRPALAAIIAARLPDISQPAKRTRLEKVIRKLARG